jgi:hypothetical protein
MKIRRMCTALWINKVTHTHSEYVKLIAFSLKQWLSESASMLRLCLRCIYNIKKYRRRQNFTLSNRQTHYTTSCRHNSGPLFYFRLTEISRSISTVYHRSFCTDVATPGLSYCRTSFCDSYARTFLECYFVICTLRLLQNYQTVSVFGTVCLVMETACVCVHEHDVYWHS